MDKLVGKYTIVPWILWWVMKIFPQPRFPWNEGTALTKPPFNELSGFVFQVFLGDFLGSPCVVLFLLLFQHLHLKSTGVFSTSAVQKWGKKSGETLKKVREHPKFPWFEKLWYYDFKLEIPTNNSRNDLSFDPSMLRWLEKKPPQQNETITE